MLFIRLLKLYDQEKYHYLAISSNVYYQDIHDQALCRTVFASPHIVFLVLHRCNIFISKF